MSREGNTSPLHVHVAESTPVHVHVKKPKRGGSSLHGSSQSYRRPTTASSMRSSQRSTLPSWVPPPGRSSQGKMLWQGPTHRLEVTRPDAEPAGTVLRLSDLSDDEDDVMRSCERKIDGLMAEVGSLKNEVDLQRSLRQVEDTQARLNQSQRMLAEKEGELQAVREELLDATVHKARLRRSMDKMRETNDLSRAETDALLRKLVEVEMDGAAAARQASELKRTMSALVADRRATAAMNAELERKKDELNQRLTDFDLNNKSLRRMLRSHQQREEQTEAQRAALSRQLGEMDATCELLRSQLHERNQEISSLQTQVDSHREQAETFRQLRDTSEAARIHLQEKVQGREIDLSRKTGEAAGLSSQLAQERAEVEYLRRTLAETKDRLEKDKEALKKATRHHKQRVGDTESALDVANAELAQKTAELSEVRANCEQWRSQANRLSREKAHLEADVASLQSRVDEKDDELQATQKSSRATSDGLSLQLTTKNHQLASSLTENERLKATVVALEERLQSTENSASAKNSANLAEVAQLRASIKQYESLISEYKAQVNRNQQELEELSSRLHEQEQEMRRVQQTGEIETEKVRLHMQQKLAELEPVPELLRASETRLRDAQDKLVSWERSSSDNMRHLGELTAKVDSQTEQLDMWKEKWRSLNDEHRISLTRAEQAERRLAESEKRNAEIMDILTKKEESMQRIQGRMDEMQRDKSALTAQLEASLNESRLQTDHLRDRTQNKEKAHKARVGELEAKLREARAGQERLTREKEAVERKCNSQIFDLQDRLEHEKHNTRSMENYVAFLKASYSNVFGETPSFSSPRVH